MDRDPVQKALIADLKAWSLGLAIIMCYWIFLGGGGA